MSSNMHLLIVDDDRDQADMLQRYFRRHRPEFSFSEAQDGEQCLEMLARENYSAVVLDYMLPGKLGIDVLREIKRLGYDIPVVLATGQGDEYLAVEAMRAGAYDYVVKDEHYFSNLPFVLDRVLERHELMIETRKLQQDLMDRNRSLLLLNKLTYDTNTRLNSQSLLPTVVENAVSLLSGDAGALMLFKENTREPEYPAHMGFTKGKEPGRVFRTDGIEGVILESEAPTLIEDCGGISGAGGQLAKMGFASVAWSPMLCMDKLLGYLVVLKKRGSGSFSAHGIEMLAMAAGQAATAIENSRLFEKAAEVQRLQEQLYQSEKLAAVGQLVSGVAHELNNPLTAVLGYAQILLMADLEPKMRKDLDKVNDAAQRCRKIVNNLLSFARRHTAEACLADINEAIKDTIALRAYELKANNIDLEESYSSDIPPVYMDVHQMQQVFLNLLINAEQAIQSVKGRRGRIKVESVLTRREGEDLVGIKISDNGPGIKEEDYTKVFEPFFTTKEPGKGTGLGLPICKGIAESHGGDIWASAVEGGGACFVIEIPAKQKTAPRRAAATAAGARVGKGSARRVLLVDDENYILEVMSEVLQGEGCSVDRAQGGFEAIEKISATDYDLVVSDIKMPNGDGRHLYRHLKHDNPVMAKRLVFITGDVNSLNTMEFIKDKGVRCLLKPFSVEDFKQVCSEYLS